MKVVKVLWVDSCNSNMNWTIAEDIEIEPMYIDSFGVVVKDTDEFLAIAQNYGDNPEQYSNITTIPKGCIKEVFVIQEDDVCENEQNHAWSEEDDIMKQHCHQMLALLRPNSSELTKDIIDNCHHWLKSLKDRVQPQPKQEWSEEDESLRRRCIGALQLSNCSDETKEELLDWLKSLRPQKHEDLPKWRRLPLNNVSCAPDYWRVMDVITSTVNGNSTSVPALVKGDYYVPLFEMEKFISKEA